MYQNLFRVKGMERNTQNLRNYFVLSFYTHLRGVADGTMGEPCQIVHKALFLYSLLRFFSGSVGFMESVIHTLV